MGWIEGRGGCVGKVGRRISDSMADAVKKESWFVDGVFPAKMNIIHHLIPAVRLLVLCSLMIIGQMFNSAVKINVSHNNSGVPGSALR